MTNASSPQLSPATSQAAEDPDGDRPAWVKIWKMPRQVMVTNETGQPIAGAAVHVVSANLDYTPDQLTGDDGTVFLRKQLYIDPPQWISVRHDGYEPTEAPYPQKWPLYMKLHEPK